MATLAEHSRSRIRINIPRTPEGKVPVWFSEAFESDSYDSEALERIEDPQSPSRSSPDAASPDGAIDREKADGAATLREQSVKENEWVEGAWPKDVKRIHEQFNPRGWRFPAVSVGIRRGAGCGSNSVTVEDCEGGVPGLSVSVVDCDGGISRAFDTGEHGGTGDAIERGDQRGMVEVCEYGEQGVIVEVCDYGDQGGSVGVSECEDQLSSTLDIGEPADEVLRTGAPARSDDPKSCDNSNVARASPCMVAASLIKGWRTMIPARSVMGRMSTALAAFCRFADRDAACVVFARFVGRCARIVAQCESG
ncbi:unnamed protein product [Phytophthora fragariaefolia]|uniref:Unnamed protein product n=1 Tax=Phytophthora fragariaefolia TaxID=1490495 RepID=A0A9W6XCK4_9STRA|nr:unnamed protein product [Phytophthora fragariaefolia]